MTEPAGLAGPEFGAEDLLGPEDLPGPEVSIAAAIDRLSASQDLLRQDFEKLAAHLTPLLTRYFDETDGRIRRLETRIRNRQERPLIVRMADLLADVRRLGSAQDVKEHVEQALMEALTSLGYQETGEPGDQFDPASHDAVSGSVGRSGIVTRVHRRGLACYGDVLIKAKVEVEPAPEEPERSGSSPSWHGGFST